MKESSLRQKLNFSIARDNFSVSIYNHKQLSAKQPYLLRCLSGNLYRQRSARLPQGLQKALLNSDLGKIER